MVINFFTGVCYEKPSLIESFGSGVDCFFSGSSRAYVIRADGKQRVEYQEGRSSLIITVLKIAACVYFPKFVFTLFCMKVLFRFTHSFSDGRLVVRSVPAPAPSYYSNPGPYGYQPSCCYPHHNYSIPVPIQRNVNPSVGHPYSQLPVPRHGNNGLNPPTTPGFNVPTGPTDRW